MNPSNPNLIFVFADQLRLQALGYAGDPNVHTPNLDWLASHSVNFTHAISGCPVCSPARASLLTGQYPDRHGVFVNDVNLNPKANTLQKAFKEAGYTTAYIGKWHLDGHGRTAYIPPERRPYFDYWKALECTHDYNHSYYYEGSDPTRRLWDGYDVIAQTRDAQRYIENQAGKGPFFLVLSWGTPHNPYETAPERFRRMYDPQKIHLRPNVPPEAQAQARVDLAGYYAHISALDEMIGELLGTIRKTGIEENTLFVFWSDHGDMLGSQGQQRKQRPWEESIRVPLLLRYPACFGGEGKTVDCLINTPDIPPTLLTLCHLPVPSGMDGLDYAPYLLGYINTPPAEEAMIACYHPFGEFNAYQHGGVEYRGLRTRRYTYARTLQGAWLLYDNETDPYQMKNLIGDPAYANIQQELEERLRRKLAEIGDEFLPGLEYVRRRGYPLDETGTVPILP